MSNTEMMSMQEISEAWSVHRRTVRRLLDEAGVPPVYLSRKKKGTIRYRIVDIERFVAESMVGNISRKG